MTSKLTNKKRRTPKLKRARITLECSIEQRKAIRIMAAINDQSMNDFIMSLVKEAEKTCHFCETYGPSENTISTIKQLERGEDVEHHTSPEAFWDSFYKETNDT